jgi:hypothetical protein
VTIGVVTTGSVGVMIAPSSSATRNGTPSAAHSTPVATTSIRAMPSPMTTAIQRASLRQ